MSTRATHCAYCGVKLRAQRDGRARLFCADRCRAAASRKRRHETPHYYPSGASQNAPKTSTISRGNKGQNGGRGFPIDLLGHASHRWPASQLDRATLQAVVAVEIGGAP